MHIIIAEMRYGGVPTAGQSYLGNAAAAAAAAAAAPDARQVAPPNLHADLRGNGPKFRYHGGRL